MSSRSITEPREIALEVPDEPPPTSVVLDQCDFAWQRLGGTWVRNGVLLGFLGPVEGTALSWAELLGKRGPVRVIWTPPATEEGS